MTASLFKKTFPLLAIKRVSLVSTHVQLATLLDERSDLILSPYWRNALHGSIDHSDVSE